VGARKEDAVKRYAVRVHETDTYGETAVAVFDSYDAAVSACDLVNKMCRGSAVAWVEIAEEEDA
jgi:hypothetical protein